MFQRLSVRAALAVGLACLSLPVAAQQTVPVPQMNQTQVYQAWTSMGRTADLSVTTGSGATPTSLGIAAPVARVCNVGATNAAYVRLGTPATVVTLLNGSVIAPGACLAMNAQGATSAVAITASSTTTVQIELGTGTPYSSLAPGSGAGSGVTSFNTRTGAVTSQAGDYTTAIVAEVTNLYFTNARAIAAPLTGYVSGAGVVAATDSVLQAIQKLNGNITALSCSQVANAACVNAANVFTAAQTVNLNAASAPTAITGTALQVVAANSVTARVEINSFGAIAAVSLARADGTAASPTAVLSGEQIGGFNGYSFVTSASPAYVGPVASVQILATQDHTSAAMGSKVQIATIPNNSTTLTTAATFGQDQSLTVVGAITASNFTGFANPSATIGTSAVNGTATTAMRSDAAPTINQAAAFAFSNLGQTAVVSASFGLSGNISSAAWTTNGVRYKNVGATLTDTTSSGTVAAAYTDTWGGNTIAASSATTFTDYFNSYFTTPVAGSNVTFTRKWALGADSLNVAGAGLASNSAVLLSGAILTGGTGTTNLPQFFIQPTGATASTTWSTAGTVIGVNTTSGFSGNLMDLQVNGGSKFLVGQNGAVVMNGTQNFQFSSRGIISSPVAGSIQIGSNDVDTNASIVAQTFRSQGALAGGTADQAGKNLTVIVSPGKGTGAGGSYIVQTAPAGSTGTSVNAPVTALTIDSTGLATFAAGVVGTSFVPTGSTVPTNGMYLSAANTIAIATSSARVLAITSSGISGNNGASALVSALASSSTVPSLVPNRGDTTTGIGAQASGNISLIAAGAEQVRVAASGVVTFPTIVSDATKTDATACIDTTTKQIYTGSGTLGVCLGTSSSRYKHDVEPLDVGLPQIMAIQPVKYRLNADHGDPNKLLYGFTAEQGGTVLPSLTGLDAQGRPNTFDYLGVVPVLVVAVQQQDRKIDEQGRKIVALEADNDNMRAELQRVRTGSR